VQKGRLAVSARLTIVKVADGAATVALEGELDYGSSVSIRPDLARLGEEVGRLDVDASALAFVDSTAIGMFVSVHNRICARGGAGVRIVAPRPPLARTLEVTGLDKVLDVVP
jgi:anti-anti-sigma factor